MAPRGLCISLNDAGVATIPQNRCRATSTKKRKRREAHTYVQDAARLKRTRRKSRPSACSQWRVDLSLKRPRSNPDKADAARISRDRIFEQLVWGPGAGVVAAGRLWSGHNRSGVASIPQSCRQVARALATTSRAARLTSQLRSPRGRRGMCGNRCESAKAYLLLSYRKFTLVTGQHDGCGSLGQVEGAQGVLVQPE